MTASPRARRPCATARREPPTSCPSRRCASGTRRCSTADGRRRRGPRPSAGATCRDPRQLRTTGRWRPPGAIVNAIGVANIAPAIMTYGTPEQQERFLRPMLRGDEIWSQGMSEPEAGSDLASLRCRRTLVAMRSWWTAQKTWNSNDRAHWCQLYVRTDPDAMPKKHQGITCTCSST
ncbi:MAG: acyl-CoA dehydrogenase family protein [Acidimicrobiales bacterium]